MAAVFFPSAAPKLNNETYRYEIELHISGTSIRKTSSTGNRDSFLRGTLALSVHYPWMSASSPQDIGTLLKVVRFDKV